MLTALKPMVTLLQIFLLIAPIYSVQANAMPIGTTRIQNGDGTSETIYSTGDKQPYIVDNNNNQSLSIQPFVSIQPPMNGPMQGPMKNGNMQGYNQGQMNRNMQGYNQGQMNGNMQRYNQGQMNGNMQGYNQGQMNGNMQGYNQGQMNGNGQGYNQGQMNGNMQRPMNRPMQ